MILFDSLITMLSEVQISFDILGISETKLIVNKDPIINIELPNYHFVSQPSSQIAGGVGFYIGLDLEFHSRQDLSITTEDFECLWIEIHCTNQTNTICSVIYRHPSSNLENFTDYLTSCIDKVSIARAQALLWVRDWVSTVFPNLETRARNTLWRLAEALGNTSESRALIGCFSSANYYSNF